MTTPYTELPLASLDRVRAHARLRIVDVRGPDEFHGELGHLPGAQLVPLETVARVAAAWPRDTPLVLVCRSGRRSATAALQLAQLGFRHLYNLSGGMLAVSDAGLPVERDGAHAAP